MALKRENLKPRDAVSLDHYESSVRGRWLETRGREAEHNKYCGGTIMVDHATGYVKTYHQVTFTAEKTLKSKRLFEKEAKSCGTKGETLSQ